MTEMYKTERVLYKAGLVLLAATVLIWCAFRITGSDLSIIGKDCMFNRTTGLYCPGCGGTRAVIRLGRGQWLRSLHYHPLVLYGAGMYAVFMISHTVERISKGRYRIGLRYRDRYVWAALVILAVNFVIKNLMLLVWNIRL